MSSESNEVNEENSRQWLTDLWLQVTNPEEERVYYDVTAYKYEEVTSNLIWRAPELCMKGILNYEQKSGVRIPRDGLAIDIGAGTGLSGQALREIVGFTGRIDALEPSTNMFAIAEPKGIYTKYFNELLLEDKETSVPGDTYDLAFSVGVFSDRSAKSSCLADVVRMVKPGGHVGVICVKRHWDGDLELVAKRLEEEGKIDIKHVEVFHSYMKDVESVSFVLQKK